MKKVIFNFTMLCMGLISMSASSVEETRYRGGSFAVPSREISIIVTEVGYFPNQVVVYKGEKVKFFITSTTQRPTCLMLKGKELFVPAKKGEVSEADIFFDKEDTFELYCPSNNFKGKITVFEHPEDARKRKAREIASEKKVKVWIPRDE